MTYRVALTEQADSDLRGIYEYIAFSLLEPENAAGQLDRLEENWQICRESLNCMKKNRGGAEGFTKCQWIILSYSIFRMRKKRQLQSSGLYMADGT